MKRTVLLIFLWLLPMICPAQKFNVKVVGITDGDTFTGLNSDHLRIRFRIYGIDAPEKKQAFGTKSKEYLSSLIFGQDITVDVRSQDAWGRYLVYVYTPEGHDVSLLMIQSGYAWHYKKYDNTPAYSNAEEAARKAGRGLWHDASPQAPWDFRAAQRSKNH